MQTVSLYNKSTGRVIGSRIVRADTAFRRLVGLLGHSSLPTGGGLWLEPSSGIHTFGMRFAIDAIGLNKHLTIVRVWSNLEPNRITSIDLKVRTVVELPAGLIQEHNLLVGHTLSYASGQSSSLEGV